MYWNLLFSYKEKPPPKNITFYIKPIKYKKINNK